MAMRELGQISEVELRQIWPDEAHNFTVWLSEQDNLDLLSAALGLDLEIVRREAPVGSYSLDLLAREREDGERYAAIENQLEPANHTHWGQLLTYAAGVQAKILIWIASGFSAPHIAAVDWLNQWTQREIECYAVEVHARQIGDSLPAAEFVPVAVPRNWTDSNSSRKIPSRPVLEYDQKCAEFFQPLVDELSEAGFPDVNVYVANRRDFPSDVDMALSYQAEMAEMDERGAWVTLCWWGGDGGMKRSNDVFDALMKEKDQIEEKLGCELIWDNRRNQYVFYLSLRRDANIDDPPEKLAEIRAWMLATLPQFRDVFNPRLERILAELAAD